VACPFFLPATRLDQGGWLHAPRLPLGDLYQGVCQAVPGQPFEPSESALHELCNCGYARGRCERFPVESADAVRFSVISSEGDSVRLIYVLEKSHAPAEHGTLEYSIRQSSFAGEPIRSILKAQARAFLDSHLRCQATAASGKTV
jgi:hypothetical protein